MTSFTATVQSQKKCLKPSCADTNSNISYKKTTFHPNPPQLTIGQRPSIPKSRAFLSSPGDADLSEKYTGNRTISTAKHVQYKQQTPVSVGPGSYTLPSCFSKKSASIAFRQKEVQKKVSGSFQLSGNEFKQLSTSQCLPSFSLRSRNAEFQNGNPGPNVYEVKSVDAKPPQFLFTQDERKFFDQKNVNPGVGTYNIAGNVFDGPEITLKGRNYKEEVM